MRCPSCGAEIPAAERFAPMIVCEYCDAAVLADEKAARVLGKMAVLALTPSGLYTGATGDFRGRPFRILGRVRWGWGAGFWDEWFLRWQDVPADDPAAEAWISEDEGNLVMERRHDLAPDALTWDDIKPGDILKLGRNQWHVNEKGTATCEGGEGRLPFALLPGEEVRYLDVASGDDAFGTIEFDEDGIRVFVGRRIPLEDIELDQTAEEAGARDRLKAERAAGDDARERIVRSADRMKPMNCFGCGAPVQAPEDGSSTVECEYCGSHLDLDLQRVDCPGCGASLPRHGGDEVRSMVCAHCHSQLDVTRPEASVLGGLAAENRPKLPIRPGFRFRWRGLQRTVVGHLRYEQKEGIERWRWDEFLVWSPKAGYDWLILDDGHLSWCAEIESRPTFDPRSASEDDKFSFLGSTWKVFEVDASNTKVKWVEGELPWVAQVGDKVAWMDAVAPPRMLSAEWTDEEMEWYVAEWIPRDSIESDIGIPLADLPTPERPAPHQPYEVSDFRRDAVKVMGAFAAVFFILMLWSIFADGREVTSFMVEPQEYAEEHLTPEFEVKEAGSLVQFDFRAPVDNEWVYLDVALVNEQDEAVLDFSAQCSYYHGSSGGESWSEGSRDDSQVVKVAEPGTYRLLVLGQAGHGNSATYPAGQGDRVTITVREGAVLTRWYVLLLVLACVWLLYEGIRYSHFHTRRTRADEED